jgi:hypothetical protein
MFLAPLNLKFVGNFKLVRWLLFAVAFAYARLMASEAPNAGEVERMPTEEVRRQFGKRIHRIPEGGEGKFASVAAFSSGRDPRLAGI